MYVRTKKDIIYKAINIYHDYRNKPLYEVETGLERLILDTDELRETAETIEELCDKFLMVLNDRFDKPGVVNSLENAKDIIKVEPRFTCYGCVGTSKGLIYVAKMNDKGELELL